MEASYPYATRSQQKLNKRPRRVSDPGACPLLDLPGEVRNIIYRFTLTTGTWQVARKRKHNPEYYARTPGWRQTRRLENLSLLLANRKINEEAAPIFWAENCFTFRDFESFILGLPPRYRRIIRHVRICSLGWTYENSDQPLWDVVFQCKGLRTLEMRAIPRKAHPAFTELTFPCNRFTRELLELRTFSWLCWSTLDVRRPDGVLVSHECRISKTMRLAPQQRHEDGTPPSFLSESFWADPYFATTCDICLPVFGRKVITEAQELMRAGATDERSLTAALNDRQRMRGAWTQEVRPVTWTVQFLASPTEH